MDENYIISRQQTLQAEFDKLNELTKTTVDEYNRKISELKKEGDEELRKINARISQIQGEYTALEYVLHPEKRPEYVENTPTEPTQHTEPTEIKNKNSGVSSEPSNVVNLKPQTEATLSEKEQAEVKEIMEQAQKQEVKEQSKIQDDVPDYLKGE